MEMLIKRICVSKIGSDHIDSNINNQDFLVSLDNVKIVLDGCGSGKYSEVGTRLFGQFLKNYSHTLTEHTFEDVVHTIFEKLVQIRKDDAFFNDNLCFTILACFEKEDEFVVLSCGDGYIITSDGKKIEFLKLDNGEHPDFPPYFIYNFTNNKVLYEEGVSFTIQRFSKKDFVNVGVATDGLRFYEKLSIIEQEKLKTALLTGKAAQINMLINRNNLTFLPNGTSNAPKFQDDITICF
jgi:hypothetical protein